MRKLTKPEDAPLDVFNECISRIRDVNLKNRLKACAHEIELDSNEFDAKANRTELHTIQSKNMVANSVNVEEMKKVYTGRMAKKLTPGRPYYDKLISLPAFGRCPLCCQRTVSTLDHYLPKQHFPSLTVTPFNLIPACQDCNKVKGENAPSRPEEETLHPYYDDVENFVWVKASLLEEEPIGVNFYVDTSAIQNELLANRLENHFNIFKLNSLYSSHAAEEIASMERNFKNVFIDTGSDGLREFLAEIAESKMDLNPNSWQSALYTCLARNVWFYECYFAKSDM